jgi:hypothetical protein
VWILALFSLSVLLFIAKGEENEREGISYKAKMVWVQ